MANKGRFGKKNGFGTGRRFSDTKEKSNGLAQTPGVREVVLFFGREIKSRRSWSICCFVGIRIYWFVKSFFLLCFGRNVFFE